MGVKKGILIVIEGIDGAGKTTQAKILLMRLQEEGFPTVYYREPSQSKWGREIKKKAVLPGSLNPEEELDLFQKDRKENVEKNLRPNLDAKRIVILDRYYYSTIAYQGAKGIDPEKIREMNEMFVVKPDLVFILDIDAGKGLERIEDRGKKDLLFEREEYLVGVRKLFKSLKGENIFHINAFRQKEKISREIEKITLKYIRSVTQ